jgi:hypothetical protein
MRAATAALAAVKAAHITVTRRNAEMKAWAMAVWMAYGCLRVQACGDFQAGEWPIGGIGCYVG